MLLREPFAQFTAFILKISSLLEQSFINFLSHIELVISIQNLYSFVSHIINNPVMSLNEYIEISRAFNIFSVENCYNIENNV